MSVFLRWGILGILSFAALLYAYNTSKRMAEAHAAKSAAPAASVQSSAAPSVAQPESRQIRAPVVEPAPAAPAHCEVELQVAQRAIEMHKQGEPFDRLLRIREIAWEESPALRARLEKVATRWFNYEGDFTPDALRIAVVSDCQQATPGP